MSNYSFNLSYIVRLLYGAGANDTVALEPYKIFQWAIGEFRSH